MTLYLGRGKYSAEGLKGLVAKPEDRTAAIKALYEAAGAKVLHLWFSGSTGDAIVIVEASQTAGMALHAALGASGVLRETSAEELLTPAQQMEAMKVASNVVSKYRPPGK